MSDGLGQLIVKALGETVYMTFFSSLAGLVLGLPLGIILAVTGPGHLAAAPRINNILSILVNAGRSFPSLILIVVLLPLARFLVGTTLGATAALVPLSVSAAPFIARIVESALKEVPRGKLEAALASGARPSAAIWYILIPEALPALVRGITLAVVAILGLTAIAGAIGAGGLGSLAIRYGYQRFRDDVMLATVGVLIVLVQGIQFLGDRVAKKISKKRHIYE